LYPLSSKTLCIFYPLPAIFESEQTSHLLYLQKYDRMYV
jgi:hypothetical protein